MVNFGPLTAEIDPVVCDTPENFNGFHVLAELLQRCRSMEDNQTLHGDWPSPGLVHNIYNFWGSCPVTDFCFAFKSCALVFWQRCCMVVGWLGFNGTFNTEQVISCVHVTDDSELDRC